MHYHHNHHHNRPDINRLLDPSYSSSARPSSSTAAYYDDGGDLHDPDYCLFPPTHPRPKSLCQDDQEEHEHLQPFHIRRPSSFSSYHPHKPSYSSSAPYFNAPLPHRHFSASTSRPPRSWDSEDTALDEAVSERDYDDDDDAYEPYPPKADSRSACSRIISRTKREFNRRRRSLENDRDPVGRASLPPSPTSDDSHQQLYHPFTRTFSLQSRSRASCHDPALSGAVADTSFSTAVEPDYGNYSKREEEEEEEEEEVAHWTPTCTQALRMQWQAIALRVRFSLFRAQKRLRRIKLFSGSRLRNE